VIQKRRGDGRGICFFPFDVILKIIVQELVHAWLETPCGEGVRRAVRW
jgi:hypothetical protein